MLKKWNWGAFWFILAISLLGALSNRHCKTIVEIVVIALMFGIPFGLIFAWMGKKD